MCSFKAIIPNSNPFHIKTWTLKDMHSNKSKKEQETTEIPWPYVVWNNNIKINMRQITKKKNSFLLFFAFDSVLSLIHLLLFTVFTFIEIVSFYRWHGYICLSIFMRMHSCVFLHLISMYLSKSKRYCKNLLWKKLVQTCLYFHRYIHFTFVPSLETTVISRKLQIRI